MKKCPFQGGDVCRPDCALYERVSDMCAFAAIAQELESVSALADMAFNKRVRR